jgi:predicted nuclease of restriction endonuclease-like (RecB) superfamily
MSNDLVFYKDLLSDIKDRIRQGQFKANISANAELLATYWDIDKMIHLRQQQEGWGKGVIPRLAVDLKNELADVKGFSERNLKFMVQFYHEYNHLTLIGKPSVSQLEDAEDQQYLVPRIGWAHHIVLIQKVKDLPTRYWYMQQTINNGWGRDTLVDMIKSNLHQRQGAIINNFDQTLPNQNSELAKQFQR